MHPDLYPFQIRGAEFLAARKAALLADEMGVGKTPQAIAACDLAGAQTALVVCPAIARVNWEREFQRWQTKPRSIGIMRTAQEYDNAEDVLITSYALAASSVKNLCKRRRDVLIMDEAHFLKNPRAQRTKAIYLKHGLASRAERCWLLTGTPMPNHPAELWVHLRALGLTPLRYRDWVEKFCLTEDDGFSAKIVGTRMSAIPELVGIMRPFTLRRRLEDVLPDLPPIRFSAVTVEPPKGAPRIVLTAEEEGIVRAIHDRIARRESVDTIAHDATHLARLRRLTGMAKVSAVIELLETDLAGGMDKAVVFGVHTAVLEAIADAFGDAAVLVDGSTPFTRRQAFIDAFQAAGGPKIFVCQLAVGATALTLTAAANVVFAETDWTPGNVAQAARRCHRIGQARPVLARLVGLRGSIDEVLTGVLLQKARAIHALQLQLRETDAAGDYPVDAVKVISPGTQ